MNPSRFPVPSFLLALCLLASACSEPAPTAEVVPAPAPVATPDVVAPAAPVAEPATEAAFDVRAFAGAFAGAPAGIDTRFELKGDGSFHFVEAGTEPREFDGTWTAEENNTQILLDPDSKSEPDRRYDIVSRDELLVHGLRNIAADPKASLRRQAPP